VSYKTWRTLLSVKPIEVSQESAVYHIVRRHIAKGQDFYLWPLEPLMLFSSQFAWSNYGNHSSIRSGCQVRSRIVVEQCTSHTTAGRVTSLQVGLANTEKTGSE
jgi:hypothetical protein